MSEKMNQDSNPSSTAIRAATIPPSYIAGYRHWHDEQVTNTIAHNSDIVMLNSPRRTFFFIIIIKWKELFREVKCDVINWFICLSLYLDRNCWSYNLNKHVRKNEPGLEPASTAIRAATTPPSYIAGYRHWHDEQVTNTIAHNSDIVMLNSPRRTFLL